MPPRRCFSMISSDGGMNAWCGHSPHFTFGLPQIPFTHSLEQAGEYPERPAFLFSHRTGKTSGRPANRRRNDPIFSADEELLVTGASGKAVRLAAWRSDISLCSSVSSSRASAIRSASRSANRRRIRAISSEASSLFAKIAAHASGSKPPINVDKIRLGLKTDMRVDADRRFGIMRSATAPNPAQTLGPRPAAPITTHSA